MSIPINTDNSVQLSYSSFPFTITDIDNYATSNFVISNSNILNTKINTKQNILTSLTNLLGDGSAITNLDYNKISLNKPTYFQSDWNSTITNKPSIYTQSEITSLLSQKEGILSFSSPLTRSTNTIGINLNSYTPFSALLSSNFVNFSQLLSSNFITNSTSGLTNYSRTGLDPNYPTFTQLNSSNFITNSTSGLTNYSRTGLDPNYPTFTQLNSSNFITNSTNSLTNYSRTGLDPNYPTFTQLNSSNFITNSTNSLTNYSRTGLDPNYPTFTILNSCNYTSSGSYLALSGGTLTGQLQLTTATGNNSLFIYSSVTNATNNIELKNNLNKSCYIGIGAGGYTGNYNDKLFIQSPTSLILNINGNGTSATPNFIINSSGNVGLATTNPTCRLSLGTPAGYKVLSLWDNATPNDFQFVGFGNNGGLCLNTNTTTDAFQFRAGVNSTTANELMRINGNGSVCIGTASATSTNTKLTISGTSSGASQPIVRIEQLAAWDGGAKNYAFQVSGYSDLGGIRINGTDTFNTIFTTGNNDMGLSTNTGVMKFITNGNERMRIDSNGNLSLGTTDTASYKMRIRGTNPTFLRIETDTSAVSQVSGIEFGIPAYTNAGTAKITSTTYGSDVNDLRFSTSSGTNGTSIKMTINGNGNISCTNDFTALGKITSTSTTPSEFSFINIYHAPLLRTTHIPFSDNNIYLRAPVIIDFDTLSFGSRVQDYLIYLYGGGYGFGINANTLRYNSANNHSFYANGIMKANIDNTGTITATTLSGTTLLASGTSKASKFMIRYGEQTGYNYNWNGTGLSGWFIGLNQFWSANADNDGTAYLTMTACGSTNSQYCWFGRVFVKGGGGTWSIITDYKTPTSGVYELFVTEHFDGSGNNVLRFRTSTPGVLTENLRFKIYG